MVVNERIAQLRALMDKNGIDVYMVPTADFHNSEYVGEHFKARAFMSGFTGSAGTLVVTKDFAGLWTDGRYFLQGEKQLAGTVVELQKMGEPGVPKIVDFVVENTPENGVAGFDGRVVMFGEGKEIATKLKHKNATVKYEVDLVDVLYAVISYEIGKYGYEIFGINMGFESVLYFIVKKDAYEKRIKSIIYLLYLI